MTISLRSYEGDAAVSADVPLGALFTMSVSCSMICLCKFLPPVLVTPRRSPKAIAKPINRITKQGCVMRTVTSENVYFSQ